MISLQTNIDSLIAQQNLNVNHQFQSNTIQQLTSGYRINSSGDDAAGLSVANQDRNQIAQITQGVANGNNGTAQLQIMDGGMSNISQILDRLQTLAVQSSSSSFTGNRSDLNAEFQSDLGELNRQAQAIGLNTGGTFAQTMDVYLGGGGGASSGAVSLNGQVTVDLSKSTVDAHSLGLAGMGMQVVAGTTDISSNSTTHSAYQIVSNANNKASLTSGDTVFYISGPGFSDGAKAKLSVNLSNVSDTTTLVKAINDAIASTSSATTASGAALKAAGITASVNTDATGAQELSFNSNNSAFQVEAGDKMANALMGNLSTDPTTPAEGMAIASQVTGAPTATGGTAFAGHNVTVQISGAGLASPISIAVDGTGTVTNAITSIKNAFTTPGANMDALTAAGISVSQDVAANSPLVFKSATGESFSVLATGDLTNQLGLGALDNNSAATGAPAFYSTISAGAYSTGGTTQGNGLATLGFSLNGGPTDGGVPVTTPATSEKAATIVGTAPTGITAQGTVDTSGALTSDPLRLSVNGTTVRIDFHVDANNSSTESLGDVAKYINSQVNSAMGWGSDVQLAKVSGGNTSGAKITLTDPYADTSSMLSVAGGPAALLGLAGTNVAGTDAVGNTVTVNMAGGDATSAVGTSVATATAMTKGINTSAGPILNFTIDNQSVMADFSTNTALINGVAANQGTAAVLTGGKIGSAGTIDMTSLKAQAATITGTAFGSSGTIDTSALLAKGGSVTGSPFGVGATDYVDTSSLMAKSASLTGTGIVGDTFSALGTGGGITINNQAVDLTDTPTTLEGVMADINNTSGVGVHATISTDGAGVKSLHLVSTAAGGGPLITIADTADSQAAGLTGGSGTVTASGTAAATLIVDTGNGAQNISWANDGNANASETRDQVAFFLNAQLNSLNHTQANNYTYASFDNVTGALTIANPVAGAGNDITVTKNAAAEALGLATTSQLGNSTGAGADAASLTVTLGSGSPQTISWGNNADVYAEKAETQAQVLTFLNAQLNTAFHTSGSPVVYAKFDTSGALQITNPTDTAGTSSITVANSKAAQALGLATSVQNGDTVANGVAAKKLSIAIDANTAVEIDFTNDLHATGASETLQQVADYINGRLNAATGQGYSSTQVYATVGTSANANTIQITGLTPGSTNGKVIIDNGATHTAAAQFLGLATSGQATNTVAGNDESVANVVAFLNASAQKALGTTNTQQIFTVNANGTISIASQTKGTQSNVSVQAVGGAGSVQTAGNSALAALGFTAGTTLANGTGPTLNSIVSTLTQAFRDNTTLRAAGLQASNNGGSIQISSSSDNNTNFRLAEYDTQEGSGSTSLGFGQVSGPFSAALTSAKSMAAVLDATGTSAIGDGTTASPYLTFKALQFGTDAQSLTFTANNAAGVQQPLTLTLRNDSGAGSSATSGATIDSAVSYINSQLQGSKNTTLQSIVAVKENVNGVEQINFLSSLSSFSVSVGTSINGNGVNGGTAATFGSIVSGTANNSAIDTLAGAQAAVTAVTAAVKALGTAQAAVGKGENQLSYAVSLAQSQITNISAAQSQIRDTNVAQQAANMTKAQVLQQATIAAMAQANQEPQAVLRLLQG